MAQPYLPYSAQQSESQADPQLQQPLNLPPLHYSLQPYTDAHNTVQEPYRPPGIAQMLDQNQPLPNHHDIQPQPPLHSQPPPAQPTPETTPRNSARTNNRLRKACDSCSIRKVKCDEAGPPCRACAALEIPCTYERPSRRRGPPNRHAEAIKKARLESQQGSPAGYTPIPPSSPAYPTLNLAPTPAPSGLSAESIVPLELLNAFIDDYFTYVHPTMPFPHEPSFREAWAQRKDLSDRFFLALLAGMVGAMVSLFPRRPRRHLKSVGKEHLFSTSNALVDLCRKVCLEARGSGYLEREGLYVYDAATSYYLLTMSSFHYRWQAADLYLGECFTIIRAIGFYKARPSYPPADFGARAALTSEHDLNFIDEEVGRRVFWTVYVTARSARAFGAQLGELPIRAPTPTQGYPPLPLEVDDRYIHATHFERQPHDTLSKMAGFNANVRVYLTHNPLVAVESAYGVDSNFDSERQKKVLMECYERVKHVLDDVPEQLLVWPSFYSRSPSLVSNSDSSTSGPITHMNFQTALQNSPEEQRQIAYEVQKANIHVSVLSSRSWFLERYWALCQQYPGSIDVKAGNISQIPQGRKVASPSPFAHRILGTSAPNANLYEAEIAEVREERESVAKDLLDVLSKIRPIHMEPNSVSFCMKIRQIASTLLPAEGDISRLQDDGLAVKYLRPVLDILMDVEKSGQPSHDEDDEEVELRRWTGLRDYQKELIARKTNSGLL